MEWRKRERERERERENHWRRKREASGMLGMKNEDPDIKGKNTARKYKRH